jgi:hypothetical protein
MEYQEPWVWLGENEETGKADSGDCLLIASHNGGGPAVFLGWDERNAATLTRMLTTIRTILDIRQAGRVEIAVDTWDALHHAVHKLLACKEKDADLPALPEGIAGFVSLANFPVDKI